MDSCASSDRLAATARWTAAVRARETNRDDRLFDDPWAASLAGPDGLAWVDARPPGSTIPIVLRTRFFDDWLLGLTAAGEIRQVVLPAAGLDTRAFRLHWPEGTELFELDRLSVLRHKARILEAAGARAACRRVVIGADLAGPWADALVRAGFEPARPAAWLLEGFLFYLRAEAGAQVIDEVSRLAAPGSYLGLDVVNGLVLTSTYTRPWVEMQAAAGAPWLGTMDDPVGFLAERGWEARLTQAGQPDANHGRWALPVIAPTMPGMPHNWLVTARR